MKKKIKTLWEEVGGLRIQGTLGESKAQQHNNTGSLTSPVLGATSTPLKARH